MTAHQILRDPTFPGEPARCPILPCDGSRTGPFAVYCTCPEQATLTVSHDGTLSGEELAAFLSQLVRTCAGTLAAATARCIERIEA